MIEENENLRAEIRDYKLLRRVFGRKQIGGLLEQAKEDRQPKQRGARNRNNSFER